MSKMTARIGPSTSRTAYLPTDYTDESEFPFTSRTESGLELIRSLQSVHSLLNELESEHNFAEIVQETNVQKQLVEARTSSAIDGAGKKTWREVAYSKLDESQFKLGKLAHTLVETMEGVLGEGQKQIQCLSDIELLLNMLEKRSIAPQKNTNSNAKEVAQAVSSQSKVLKLLIQPQVTSRTADKAIQNGHPAEESILLQEMDRQHYYQMLDAFHSLKFSVEVLAPASIIRPQESKFVERVNRKR